MTTEEAFKQLITFCQIQLAIIADREERLQKELLDCRIQNEFLTEMLSVMNEETLGDDV